MLTISSGEGLESGVKLYSRDSPYGGTTCELLLKVQPVLHFLRPSIHVFHRKVAKALESVVVNALLLHVHTHKQLRILHNPSHRQFITSFSFFRGFRLVSGLRDSFGSHGQRVAAATLEVILNAYGRQIPKIRRELLELILDIASEHSYVAGKLF